MNSFQHIFSYGLRDEDEPELEEQPEWAGPPDDELGEAVPVSRAVGRSQKTVVALRAATAYPTGTTLAFRAVARGLSRREGDTVFHEQHFAPGEDPADAFLRLGVELADGSRVSNLGNPKRHLWMPDRPPEGPILSPRGSSGGTSGPGRFSLEQTYWLWPLPPPGPLRVFTEWPALDLELTGVETDTAAILDAARRSQRLWPD